MGKRYILLARKKLAKTLEERFSMELPNSELFFLQALFSLSQYHYYEGSEMTPKKEIELYKNREEDQMGQQLLALLAKAYPNLDRNERFILEVYEFLDKLLIDNAIPEWMMISKSNLTAYVQNECQQIYQDMETCLHKWQLTYPSVRYNDYHLTKLTLLVRSGLNYKSKRAFLVIGEEFSIRHYIANLIKNEIGIS